ncbi:CaiB/BaiF CoA transferase family protein [Nocardia sp. NPDC051570]|uniref:CaiB/BaiF CoA transferase family protein n=1 Tax=Nocardia sp. NPDC051570 TaxID=3364324 RepID=UPI0037883E56
MVLGERSALAGLLVADFSRVLAAPYATMLLADLGAEVIKVERPGGGDDTRSWGPPYAHEQATYFRSVNRNKRSVTLDLGDEQGRRRARELARRADVLVENFRPGTMAKFGLSYEQVRSGNPGVVYCSISAFGAAEGAALPGYDLLLQAVGGLMSVTGPRPGEPTKVGVAVVDILAGLHASVGILAALRHREATGRGQHVEVNLLSSLLSGMVNQSAGYTMAGVVPGIMGNRHPSIVPYEVFATADRPLALAVGTDAQFAALCRTLGAADLLDDARFIDNPSRVAHVAELTARLTQILGTRTADEWHDLLTPAGVPCGPVNDLAEAFALAERLGLAPRVGGDLVANPIGLSETPAEYRTAPPVLGADDAELLTWLDSD